MDRRRKLSGIQMHIIHTYQSRCIALLNGTITKTQANLSEMFKMAEYNFLPKEYLLYAVEEQNIFSTAYVKGSKYHPPKGWVAPKTLLQHQ